MTKKPYGSVLIRSVKILDYLSQQTQAKTLSEIAEKTEMTLSTTHKIMDTLELVGFVKKHQAHKKYTLGPRLIQIANAAFIQFDFVRDTYPALKHLFDRIETTINLGMLQDNEILYINKFSGDDTIYKSMSRIGFTQDLYCSAMGKAVLAQMSDSELEKYLVETQFVPKTNHTIVDTDTLKKEIEKVRQAGYGIDDREAEDNVYCIGAVIDPSLTDEVYAFSISISYDAYNHQYRDQMIDELVKTKAVIEYQLFESGPNK
ncbi:IclR family transcriptional regulator [Aerococcaceae bacterium DSM 111020]|nr:IclR family transcriptional regulator [Aerococcaceae bacterium DSM 111020]